MPDEKSIEFRIDSALTGDARLNALDFTAFLRENGITPEHHESGDGWSVMYSGESVGFILVNGAEQFPGPWTIWFNSCDFGDGGDADYEVKETAWTHASICGNFSSGGKNCGCGNQPGFRRAIFGKTYENRCHSPLMFFNPDAKTLDHVKKLMLLLKHNAAA
jgi:hypothetical protein